MNQDNQAQSGQPDNTPRLLAALGEPMAPAPLPAQSTDLLSFLASEPEGSTRKVLLTPELAQALLVGNTTNRPKRNHYVEKLSRTIQRGEWRFNGDTVRVSRTGKVLDGQHRLEAVVKTGQPITILLVTGLDDTVFSTIDRGLSRKTGDMLQSQGVANGALLAAIANQLLIFGQTGDPYRVSSAGNPTAPQQLELVADNPSLHDTARWVKAHRWSSKYVSPTFLGFCHAVFTAKYPEAAKTFFDSLDSGVGLDEGSPILHLRSRLVDGYTGRNKMRKEYRAALVFKAFKLFREGASIKTLRLVTEGPNAEQDLFSL